MPNEVKALKPFDSKNIEIPLTFDMLIEYKKRLDKQIRSMFEPQKIGDLYYKPVNPIIREEKTVWIGD